MSHSARPSVLFVCVKNSGKSQTAAGLMRKISGDPIHVYSAGTKPGDGINATSAESLAEVGVDIGDETPKPIDAALLRDVDFVITIGREAHVAPVPGPRFENWDTDEPSERGIDGIERMRLVRDDIAKRVADLLTRNASLVWLTARARLANHLTSLFAVGVAGFEPTTSSSRTKRATKLRHTPREATTAYRTGSR